MKKIIFVLVALMALAGCNKQKKETINIGAILPLTGSASVWGKNAKMGIDLAISEINSETSKNNIKFKIIYQDSKSETKSAVSALQQMLSTNNPPIIIGDIASSSVLAMAPIAEKNKVVLLSPGASNPDISKAGDYIFRDWQSDALEGDIDAIFAIDTLKVNNASVLYVNNGYGVGLKEYFIKTFKSKGGEILSIESFEQGATDMRTQLNKIKLVNPELIYMPSYPNEMATVLKQAKELNLKIQFLSTQAFDDPTILNTAKDAANGVIFSVPTPPDTLKPVVANFISNYKKMYDTEPGVCSDTGYDAFYLVYNGLKAGCKTGTDFKNFLYNVKNYQGASGSITFDKNGDVIKPFSFKTVKNNSFENYGKSK